jgi:hypothetical protein
MAQTHLTRELARTEEAIIVLFCLIDDAYYRLNPSGRRYASLKRLSDSEVLTLAIFQQLRGVESERSFLRDVSRFFAHLFPGMVGLVPSSLHRRLRKLRRFLEPLRRTILPELVGDPETLLIDSTLLEVLHPRQVGQSEGFDGAAWGEVGLLFGLWGKAAPDVRHQRGARLLRAHPGERGGGALDRRTARRGEPGGGGWTQVAGRPRLPERGVGGSPGRVRGPAGNREGRPARPEAAGGDLLFEP